MYIHRTWPYNWWFPHQKSRIYTVYLWFWPTLYINIYIYQVFCWSSFNLVTVRQYPCFFSSKLNSHHHTRAHTRARTHAHPHIYTNTHANFAVHFVQGLLRPQEAELDGDPGHHTVCSLWASRGWASGRKSEIYLDILKAMRTVQHFESNVHCATFWEQCVLCNILRAMHVVQHFKSNAHCANP
jgi:hypothetical protein